MSEQNAVIGIHDTHTGAERAIKARAKSIREMTGAARVTAHEAPVPA